MKTLELEFKSGQDGLSQNPHLYTQVKRKDRAVIYKRTEISTGRVAGYEVFRISVKPKGTKIFTTVLEDDEEQYPGASQFGRTAWFVSSMERAEERFEQILQGISDSEAEEAPSAIIFPVGEFSVKEFGQANGMEYPQAFINLKSAETDGMVKFSREERRNQKGKPTRLFVKIT